MDAKAMNATAQEIIENSVAVYLKNLPAKVEDILNRALLSLLGFKNESFDRSRLEIDHCNGRRGTIIEIVERKCKQALEEKIGPIVDQNIAKIVAQHSVQIAVQKE